MKQRGKTVKTEQDNSKLLYDFNYFASSSSLCKKHPSNPSPVGVCSYCLNEKLISLICSDCGEQRLSSCSCSDISSYRNSYCNLDVGSVGRISFLIENDKCSNFDEQKTRFSHMKKMKQSDTEDIVMLKRSNSCAIGLKKNYGFWKIGKLFRRKRDNDGFSEKNRGGFDQKSEDCVMDVSRSRSLSSFMDGSFESAKVSNFTEFEPRKSEFIGGLKELKHKISFKETDVSKIDDDDDEFIDLKIDLHKSQTEHSVFKEYDALDLSGNGEMGSSSCRFTVNDRGIKKVKSGHLKAWNCIFNHHSRKKDLDHILES